MTRDRATSIFEEGGISLTQEFQDAISASRNPVLFIIFGKVRGGKSTLLNILANGIYNSPYELPFGTGSGIKNCSVGCNWFGPINSMTMAENFGIPPPNKEADIFLFDTEGISALDAEDNRSIIGFLSLLPVAGVIDVNNSTNFPEEVSGNLYEIMSYGNLLSESIESQPPGPKFFVTINQVKLNIKRKRGDNVDYLLGIARQLINHQKQIINDLEEKGLKRFESQQPFYKNKIYQEISFFIFNDVPTDIFDYTLEDADRDKYKEKCFYNEAQSIAIKLFDVINKRREINGNEIIQYIKSFVNDFTQLRELIDISNLQITIKNILKDRFNKSLISKIDKLKDDINDKLKKSYNISDAVNFQKKDKFEEYVNKDEQIRKLINYVDRKDYEIIWNNKKQELAAFCKDLVDKESKEINDIINDQTKIKNSCDELCNKIKAYKYQYNVPKNTYNQEALSITFNKLFGNKAMIFNQLASIEDLGSLRTLKDAVLDKIKKQLEGAVESLPSEIDSSIQNRINDIVRAESEKMKTQLKSNKYTTFDSSSIKRAINNQLKSEIEKVSTNQKALKSFNDTIDRYINDEKTNFDELKKEIENLDNAKNKLSEDKKKIQKLIDEAIINEKREFERDQYHSLNLNNIRTKIEDSFKENKNKIYTKYPDILNQIEGFIENKLNYLEDVIDDFCFDQAYKIFKSENDSKDFQLGIRYYQIGVEKGNRSAMNNLGVCYSQGRGVQQNYDEALKLFKRSEEKGCILAKCNIGVCYENGEGVSKDMNEALRRYRETMEDGCSHAYYCLGHCYQYGKGVSEDKNEAIRLYKIAAEKGNEHAQQKLKEFE